MSDRDSNAEEQELDLSNVRAGYLPTRYRFSDMAAAFIQCLNTLSQSDVVTKYKKAAEIANSTRCASLLCTHVITAADALTAVLEACKAGAKVVDVCQLGDTFINECVEVMLCREQSSTPSSGPPPRSTRAKTSKRASATPRACRSTSTPHRSSDTHTRFPQLRGRVFTTCRRYHRAQGRRCGQNVRRHHVGEFIHHLHTVISGATSTGLSGPPPRRSWWAPVMQPRSRAALPICLPPQRPHSRLPCA